MVWRLARTVVGACDGAACLCSTVIKYLFGNRTPNTNILKVVYLPTLFGGFFEILITKCSCAVKGFGFETMSNIINL